MAVTREEAAPTFASWKARLETAENDQLKDQVNQFLQILETLGTPMIEGPDVNFVYYGPQARHVELTGEFNQWGMGAQAIAMKPISRSGFFYHNLQLNEPARLEYKFIVDGKWLIDPLCHNQVDNGLGNSNSYFVVGDFREPPELEWREEISRGRVEHFDFTSKHLVNTREVFVYLPAAYASEEGHSFGSLYVHDGGEYLERAKLATVLDNLIAEAQIPPLIAVMVDPVSRMEEYWANDRYVEFLCDELLPQVEQRYRTKRDRRTRGVMGASLGGLISVYSALSHPELFSLVGGQSSALMIEEQKLASKMLNTKGVGFRFYLDVGRYEPRFIPAHERFVALLKRKRWPTCYQELPGGHNWSSWRAHLKHLLVFLWNSSQPQRRPARRGAPSGHPRN
jgi:enterochelin esterase-like enzyme